MCGIIVQLPLPDNIDTKAVLDSIPLDLDVDGLSSKYDEMFYNNDNKNVLVMPTASAVMKILNSIENMLENKNIAVIGHGKLVGKPIVHLLKQERAVVNVVDKKTEETRRKEILSNADIIITAVGKPNILRGLDVHDGVSIIDAGTLEVSGMLVGDADFASLEDKCSFITPTPGGVGPVTVACLMYNVLLVAKNKK
jgi:methylenetetrahydrofolate dehydrogenase (NADP+)/methenyltetrahydrofolate cyclohydrolase